LRFAYKKMQTNGWGRWTDRQSSRSRHTTKICYYTYFVSKYYWIDGQKNGKMERRDWQIDRCKEEIDRDRHRKRGREVKERERGRGRERERDREAEKERERKEAHLE
jgi:hypothetical protein